MGLSRRKFTREFKLADPPADRLAELERKIGQQALEIDFLKGCLQHRRAAAVAGIDGKTAIYQQIAAQRDGGQAVSVKRMCGLARVSRAGFIASRRVLLERTAMSSSATPSSASRWSFPVTAGRA